MGVKALIRNASGEILLLKVNQKNFHNPSLEDRWDIPGGRVLEDHSIEKTLERELEEEIQVRPEGARTLLSMEVSNIEIPLNSMQRAGLILAIYQCQIPKDSEIKLSEEHLGFEWVLPQEAARRLMHKYPLSFISKIVSLPN